MSRRRRIIPISQTLFRRSLGAVLGVLVLTLAVLVAPARGADDDPANKAKVAELIKNLDDRDAQIRHQAVKSLGDMGPKAKEAVPALIKTFGDPELRTYAFRALGAIGREAKETVPALIKTLAGPDANVRQGAARALGQIGPKAKDAVPELIRLLGDPDAGVRRGAATALGQIGPESKLAIPELERLAEKDPDESVRQNAHDALEKIRK
jgi:HEAT repeat protein